MNDARKTLDELSAAVLARFHAEKRVLSFEEYLDEVVTHPWRHTRDAARYVLDCFDHFGSYEVERPTGTRRRYRLFDQEFRAEEAGDGWLRRDRLIGQEDVQELFYRALRNYSRQGRINQLILMHGPNGSAKSTFAACVMHGLEHYSTCEEGALYRFSWVFQRGAEDKSIGFGARGPSVAARTSLAHTDGDKLDAKLPSELREHPLLLLPLEERRSVVRSAYDAHGIKEAPPDWIWRGNLGRKNRDVFEALLTAHNGDLKKVLSHVQVERYVISRRYRVGAVTIGPQMAVDATERQVTADRSLGNLPGSLSALSLFETFGELVDGAGGLIEYSDMLKRPLDAWKYLLLAIESGEVALQLSILPLNSVLLASTNEAHLAAFRQHPEYNSFRARLNLIRVAYLLDYRQEQAIYDTQVVPQVRVHIAPHATRVAAIWAVLTRVLRSKAENYEDRELGKIAAELTPLEKVMLYAEGRIPSRLPSDAAKILRSGIGVVANEFDGTVEYEGMSGASPRELRMLIMDAAQDGAHRCLSPVSVLEALRVLCEQGDYEFLGEEVDGGFHDHHRFVDQVHQVWLGLVDNEARTVTGLAEEASYRALFERYVTHVSLWVKKERAQNPHTGEYEEPDEGAMGTMERLLGVTDATEFRRNLISNVAAHAIDHPGQPVDHAVVFARHLERVKEAYFAEHGEKVSAILRHILALLDQETGSLDDDERTVARAALGRLHSEYGYCDECARSALGELLRARYQTA